MKRRANSRRDYLSYLYKRELMQSKVSMVGETRQNTVPICQNMFPRVPRAGRMVVESTPQSVTTLKRFRERLMTCSIERCGSA